jgi:hypothetical protein
MGFIMSGYRSSRGDMLEIIGAVEGNGVVGPPEEGRD